MGRPAAVVEELLGAERGPDLLNRGERGEVRSQLFARHRRIACGDLPPAVDPAQREHAARPGPEGALDHDGVRERVPQDVGGIVPPAQLLGHVDAVGLNEVIDVELAAGDHTPAGRAELGLPRAEPPLLVEAHLERGTSYQSAVPFSSCFARRVRSAIRRVSSVIRWSRSAMRWSRRGLDRDWRRQIAGADATRAQAIRLRADEGANADISWRRPEAEAQREARAVHQVVE